LASIDLNEQNSDDTVDQVDKKSLKTWYISLGDTESSTKLPSLDDWVSVSLLIEKILAKKLSLLYPT
jgi:hypothetical protein